MYRPKAFFLDNTILYTGGKIQSSKIDHFKNLWLSDKLDKSDREIIWDWMDLFMKIGETYENRFGVISGWSR